MEVIMYLIAWFALGFIGFIINFISDIRGKEYDEEYFVEKGYNLLMFIFVVYCGGLTLIISILVLLKDKYNISFIRLLYKIANIGTEKGKNKGEIKG